MRWYAIALLLTPGIALLWQLGYGAFGHDGHIRLDLRGVHRAYVEAFGTTGPYGIETGQLPSMGLVTFLQCVIEKSPTLAVLNFIAFAILTGPISEEFGWRGYALPRLQERQTTVRAAVVVGLLWGAWHTGPDFWRLIFQGDARAFLYPAVLTIGTVPLSILLAWLFNVSGGSLLPGMLLHASFNSTAYILTLTWVGHPGILIGAELVVGLWIAVAVVIVTNGAGTGALQKPARTIPECDH
jgi:membrane protease YdiL (CAAX protease family)